MPTRSTQGTSSPVGASTPIPITTSSVRRPRTEVCTGFPFPSSSEVSGTACSQSG
ncbi:MAG: hypothetical protein H6738_12060 [Alphaproteobacteria bacterium]|nr:hypothetical protein [Alphaproteobacteria bacterium]MCB9697506.1 hypothetical protein [Alphaproteobacteria bacterium]